MRLSLGLRQDIISNIGLMSHIETERRVGLLFLPEQQQRSFGQQQLSCAQCEYEYETVQYLVPREHHWKRSSRRRWLICLPVQQLVSFDQQLSCVPCGGHAAE